jgi:dihydroflavonol-4-reductase
MKVLVTGATGFIGGNLARELSRQGYRVRALARQGSNTRFLQGFNVEIIEGDLLEPASLARAMDGCKALFHAAAMYTFWARNPRLIYDINVKGTENILIAAKAANIYKIVYTSSESVVGIDKPHGLGNEKMQGNIEKIPSDYKKSKFMAENLALKMCREGLPLVVVNPTTPIGAYDIKPTPTGQMVRDYLNRKMFACVNTGLNVIDVEDVAKGHILALEKGRIGNRYLLGNKNLTFREILEILSKITGIRAPSFNIPISVALCAGYIDQFVEGAVLKRHPRIPVSAVKASRKFRHFDCSLAIRELGLPQTPVEIAFEKAVKWFRENGYAR